MEHPGFTRTHRFPLPRNQMARAPFLNPTRTPGVDALLSDPFLLPLEIMLLRLRTPPLGAPAGDRA